MDGDLYNVCKVRSVLHWWWETLGAFSSFLSHGHWCFIHLPSRLPLHTAVASLAFCHFKGNNCLINALIGNTTENNLPIENVSMRGIFLTPLYLLESHEVWKPLQELTHQVLSRQFLKANVMPCLWNQWLQGVQTTEAMLEKESVVSKANQGCRLNQENQYSDVRCVSYCH